MKPCLSPDQRRDVIDSLQRYFREELDHDLRDMPAGSLLDYLLEEIGPFAYNAGVEDAQRYFLARTEELTGVCFEEGLTHWDTGAPGARRVRRKS